MSDKAISALAHAAFEGDVTVTESGLQGMVTLKADLSDSPVAAAVKSVCAADMPEARKITTGKGMQVAWMAPDEVLILCPHEKAGTLAAELGKALQGVHHLAVNVSDARAVFTVGGPPGVLKDSLSKLTPADMAALGPGEMRRTRLAQVAAAIWFEEPGTARVICFRSVAKYVFDLLATAARPGGKVGYHR